MSEHLNLGPAPRPATGADLLARLHAAAVADAPERLRLQLEAAFTHATAEVDGADVSLDLDATGLSFDGLFGDETGASDLVPTRDADVRETDRGTLRSLTVRAHPMHVEGVPVDVGITLEGIAIRWVEVVDDGTVGIDVAEQDAANPVRGHVRIEAPQAETVDAVRRVAEAALAEQGVTLADLDVQLTSQGPRTVRAEGTARIKKGFLGAPASASATLRVDDALQVHVEDLRITSSNVIVAGLLAAVRGKVEQATAKPIDLAAQLPPGVRVTDVTLTAGDRIGVEARVG
ncbi:hypothetical protein [Agrococcus jejuensis]|uniref:DUF2993 domain-containing protein n=1 Tax=Agrococcus jejuensis TaxID=399736 RepID=A0A1G8CNU1_9MICO|nr:hypothetical protein [Agrococcus jejuensis]SDH46530.1 hypothetical protein SAMN04489720_1339 [Agrococcus jejuensis]